MSFIKKTYQEKKNNEIDKKIKEIFSVPISTVYEIKQDLENRNKILKKKNFHSMVVVFFLSIALIWQVFFPYSVIAS
jgi:hypothetical protein|tara:strand:- start:129 stop:359 length:231 start_codon:yes stop_codon:yes gene_type:complete